MCQLYTNVDQGVQWLPENQCAKISLHCYILKQHLNQQEIGRGHSFQKGQDMGKIMAL